MAHQQQQRALWRLLQNLEQGIGALVVEFVDRIDDGDPPSPLARGRAEKRDRPAHVVDLDVLAQLAGLFVDRPHQHEQVALRLRGDPPCHRMLRIDRKRRRRLHGRRARVRMCQHKPRHPVGERGLADTGRPADQPGMRQAAAAVGGEQRALGLLMAHQYRGCARMCGFVKVVAGFAHNAAPSSATGAVAGWSRSLTAFQMRSATSGFGCVASMITQRSDSTSTIMR